MTTKERIMACYRRQSVDHAACAIYTRYLPRGSVEREARNLGMGIIDYVPPVSMMAPPWHMLDGFLSEAHETKVNVSYRWDGAKRIERRAFELPEGSLWADIEQDSGGVGSEHIRKHYLEREEDYRTMLALAKRVRFSRNDGLVKDRMEALGEDGVVLGRLDRSPFQKCLIELGRPDLFLIDVFEQDELIEELLATLEERLLEAVEMACDSACDVLWVPDNVTAEMTSPSLFRQYCLPYYQRVTKMAHQAGKLVLAHFDGKLRPLQQDIEKAEFDGIESVTLPEMNGDMSLEQARAAFPNAAIIPNFPSNKSFDPSEDIVEWVQELAQSAGNIPLLLEISEDLPKEQTGRVAMAVASALYER